MSIASLEHTLIRIKGAAPESAIAVFKSTLPGKLNSMFAATVKTQEMINGLHPHLIGVFDQTMDISAIEAQLALHVAQPEEAIA